jgi:4-diphosphocytidyl-2-C-methyl-D-erythritol kinase
VPFFLGESPLARGRGRGERLEPLPALPPADLVLVSPPVHVSTGEAYEALGLTGNDEPGASEPAVDAITSWDALAEVAGNDFEVVMRLLHPQITRALHALRAAGAGVALMSGSGSTCWGLFSDRSVAAAAAAELRQDLGWACVAVRTLREPPPVERG